jgi:hypothetical protein
LNRQFAAAWQGGIGLDFAHQNQVIDTSITETNLSTALLNGQMVKLHPSLKWTLTGGEWVEGELMVDRQFVRRPFDGYWEGGPKVKSGFSYGSQSEFTASYQFLIRGYDTRTEFDPLGNPIPGTALEFFEHRAELGLKHNWDAQRHWRSTTKLTYLRSEDDGPGYFNYRGYTAAERFQYVNAVWDLRAELKAAWYEYPVQPVSDTDARKRRKTDLNLVVRGERALTKRLKAFAEYEFGRSDSNRRPDEYGVNIFSGGLELEF